MMKHGISSVRFNLCQWSPILYIISLAGFILPFPWLSLLRPIPVGFLLLIPGIILGKNISSLMERSGVDAGVNAGRQASNIMWLGIGTGIYIAFNLIFWSAVNTVGK